MISAMMRISLLRYMTSCQSHQHHWICQNKTEFTTRKEVKTVAIMTITIVKPLVVIRKESKAVHQIVVCATAARKWAIIITMMKAHLFQLPLLLLLLSTITTTATVCKLLRLQSCWPHSCHPHPYPCQSTFIHQLMFSHVMDAFHTAWHEETPH